MTAEGGGMMSSRPPTHPSGGGRQGAATATPRALGVFFSGSRGLSETGSRSPAAERVRACDSEEGGEAVENQNGLLKDVSRTDHQKVGRRVKPYG